MFRNKRQDHVVTEIERFCDVVGQAVTVHAKVVLDYLAGNRQFKEESKRVHELESGADLIRFEVEREMYHQYNELFAWGLLPGMVLVLLGTGLNMMVAKRIV